MTSQKMLAWVSKEYGTADKVLRLEEVAIPRPSNKQLLIRVMAASINPIDWRMLGGYGRTLFPKMRGKEFPVTLGRDFSGEIVGIGADVTQFQIGQKVVGTIPPKLQGAHAQYLIVDAEHVAILPEGRDAISIAAIPYVAMTTWSALIEKAGLTTEKAQGKKLFVHAGSGGIGSFTIQFAKTLGMHVTSTCGPSNVALLDHLGADEIIDYSEADYAKVTERFDYVYDTLGGAHESPTLDLVKKGGQYISIVHPLVPLLDKYGLIFGSLSIAGTLVKKKIAAKLKSQSYNWGLFSANGPALQMIMDLVEQQKIKPIIDSILPMADLPEAYTKIGTGRTKGKIVLKW